MIKRRTEVLIVGGGGAGLMAAVRARREGRRAALVTSDYHLTRALWIARDLRLEVCGVAARGSRRLLPAMKARLNETMSWLLFFIRKINGKGRIS